MKKDIGYFMDIERFVQWTYKHNSCFGSTEENDRGKTTRTNWRIYKDFPKDENIEFVNDNLVNGESPFEKINIADMMICINNAKDHNRGNCAELSSITCTGKKVMTILLLGRILDWGNEDGFLTVSKDKHNEVYTYLANFTNRPKNVRKYFYLPGRTVSFKQLCELSNNYKNGITSRGIHSGLMRLMDIELVECVDKDKDLYKLSFEGCRKFLERNK